VEWLKLHQLSKCAALSSNPSAMKNKKVLQWKSVSQTNFLSLSQTTAWWLLEE
jgi:hypothetical protein